MATVVTFRNALNASELAFVVGALSHYIGDLVGFHPSATNLAVPVESVLPKLRRNISLLTTRAAISTSNAFDIDGGSRTTGLPLFNISAASGYRFLFAFAYYQTYWITSFTGTHKHRFKV